MPTPDANANAPERREVPDQPPRDFDYKYCWPTRYTLWNLEWPVSPLSSRLFQTEEAAKALVVASYGSFDPALHEVRPAEWRHRESAKVRKAPVWEDEPFWVENHEIWQDHFLHVSMGKDAAAGTLAYISDEQKGSREIYTPLKPGRYLSRFFGTILTEKQIQFFAQWQISGQKPSAYTEHKAFPLCFANTADDIEDVYLHGPWSCMTHEASRYSSHVHPVRIYAAGDLAIAYLKGQVGTQTKIIARALVWPERLVAGRIYPTSEYWQKDGFSSQQDSIDANSALFERLRSAGYKTRGDQPHNAFQGAKMKFLALPRDARRLVVPYLDHSYKFNVIGTSHLEMDAGGSFAGDSTDGVVAAGPVRLATCNHCTASIFEANSLFRVHQTVTLYNAGSEASLSDERVYCPSCVENFAFYCQGFDRHLTDNNRFTRYPNGVMLSDAYVEVRGNVAIRNANAVAAREAEAERVRRGRSQSAPDAAGSGSDGTETASESSIRARRAYDGRSPGRPYEYPVGISATHRGRLEELRQMRRNWLRMGSWNAHLEENFMQEVSEILAQYGRNSLPNSALLPEEIRRLQMLEEAWRDARLSPDWNGISDQRYRRTQEAIEGQVRSRIEREQLQQYGEFRTSLRGFVEVAWAASPASPAPSEAHRAEDWMWAPLAPPRERPPTQLPASIEANRRMEQRDAELTRRQERYRRGSAFITRRAAPEGGETPAAAPPPDRWND